MDRRTAQTFPPAKLNLFLELVRRRPDGYHDIDTVMVPIDWRDRLQVRRVPRPRTRLSVHATACFGQDVSSIPADETNLVCRALDRFADEFAIVGGFDADLVKNIPAGAGMGGASSDAASALRCAAVLCGIPTSHPNLFAIAAELGSDIPFFLGLPAKSQDLNDQGVWAIRATGRGEKTQAVSMGRPLDVTVVYPRIILSTGRVYEACQVPQKPVDGDLMVRSLLGGDSASIEAALWNRLSDPARILAPEIDGILQSVWRNGFRTCQLTGSGSACFALTHSSQNAVRLAEAISDESDNVSGPIVMATRTTRVPAVVRVV